MPSFRRLPVLAALLCCVLYPLMNGRTAQAVIRPLQALATPEAIAMLRRIHMTGGPAAASALASLEVLEAAPQDRIERDPPQRHEDLRPDEVDLPLEIGTAIRHLLRGRLVVRRGAAADEPAQGDYPAQASSIPHNPYPAPPAYSESPRRQRALASGGQEVEPSLPV